MSASVRVIPFIAGYSEAAIRHLIRAIPPDQLAAAALASLGVLDKDCDEVLPEARRNALAITRGCLVRLMSD